VRYLDDHLARLFEGLRERSVFDSCLIIVVADHGEELGEHGSLLHTQTYEETVAVPLIVKPPRGTFRPARVQALTGVIDITPTLLDHAGIPAPEQVQGRSLLRQLRPEAVDPQRVILSRKAGALEPDTVWTGRSDVRGPAPDRRGRLERLKLVATKGRPPELYDLAADPGERQSLATARPGDLARLLELRDELARESEELRMRLEGGATTGEQVLGEEELTRLKALGYAEQ
jgi:arylsulfatase A-like enzyme